MVGFMGFSWEDMGLMGFLMGIYGFNGIFNGNIWV